MSKRIANSYKNFLEYSRRREEAMSSNAKTPSTAKGLLTRKNAPQQNASASGSQFKELEKVAEYVKNIRSYRMS